MLEYVENETILLRTVRPSDLEDIRKYRSEFLACGDSMDGTSRLRDYEDMQAWYNSVLAGQSRETCNPKWVPATQFVSIRKADGMLLGMLDVRHELNQACLEIFGHAGYSIRPSQRQKGYAKQQLALAKEVFISMGIDRIMVACYKHNPASAKTILANGGVLENEITEADGLVTQRYWIPLRK